MEHLDDEPTQIRSGHFGDPAATYGYRFERLGEVFVERIIWAELPAPRRLAGVVVADTGYVWYRYLAAPRRPGGRALFHCGRRADRYANRSVCADRVG